MFDKIDVKVSTLLAALFISNSGLILSTYVSMKVAQAVIEVKVENLENAMKDLKALQNNTEKI